MKRALLSASVAMAVAVPGTGVAQQKVTLRVADVYPVGHPVANSTARQFMDEVKKSTGGSVDFQYFPAEQLGKGKDLLTLTQSGVTDIGLVVPSYVSDKMPLSAVSELPGGFVSSCEGTMAMWRMSTSGVLSKHEFAPNGVRVLIVHAFAPFQFVTTRNFDGLKSIEGQKIRSLGAVTDSTIRALKGTPVRIPAPEINEAMSRGTIDGGLMGYPTVLSYDLARIVKFGTQGANFGGAVVTYAISENKWRSLAPDVQKALLAAGESATRNGCEFADKAVDPSARKLEAAGVKLVKLSSDAEQSLKAALATVGDQWAADLDKRGKPGHEVLKAFRETVQTGR
jgi:TRAP-type C4-dicarboxylate transport system substrate-binding protein